jgi:hypothetical protein
MHDIVSFSISRLKKKKHLDANELTRPHIVGGSGLNASAADLVDELSSSIDNSRPIYNPTTQAGILPPEGYR